MKGIGFWYHLKRRNIIPPVIEIGLESLYEDAAPYLIFEAVKKIEYAEKLGGKVCEKFEKEIKMECTVQISFAILFKSEQDINNFVNYIRGSYSI